jgi:hypothetical protein
MKLENEAVPGQKKTRCYHFPIDLYNKHVTIYVSDTIEKACKGAELYYKGLDLSDMYYGNSGAAIKIESENGIMGNIIILGLEHNHCYEDLLETCAHEALHVSWDITEKVGIHLSADNHEAQAYLMHNIFRACLTAVDDYIKRYKIKF